MSDDNPVLRELAERIASIERRIGALSVLEAKLTSASIIDATSAATANKIVLRDGSAGAAFAALTATTLAVSGSQTIGGSISITNTLTVGTNATVTGVLGVSGISVLTGGAQAPRNPGAAVYAMDYTQVGSVASVANNATYRPFGNTSTFGGVIAIHESSANGGAALFLVHAITAGVAGVTEIGDTIGLYTCNFPGTASQINVYLTGGILEIENKQGSTVGLTVAVIARTRTVA